MSGVSDVRLVLRGQELVAGQEQAVQASDAPVGFSRWALFRLRRRTRKALLDMTPEQLRDIGLSASQARQEGLKPFWRS